MPGFGAAALDSALDSAVADALLLLLLRNSIGDDSTMRLVKADRVDENVGVR